MDFPILLENIERIECKDSLTLKDLLGLIVGDLVDDLDNMDLSLSELPLGNDSEETVEAISLLCSLARMVGTIYKKHKDTIDPSVMAKMWEKSKSKLDEATDVLEEVQKDIENNKALIREYEQKKKQIDESMKDNNELKDKLNEVQNSVNSAEEALNKVKQSISDKELELNAKKEELVGWKENFERQCLRQEELDVKLQNLISENDDRYQVLCQKQEKARALFDSIKNDSVLSSDWIYDQKTITTYQEKCESLLNSVETELDTYYQSLRRLLNYLETGK